MVTASPGGTVRLELNRINEYTDGLGKKLKFEENKNSPGDFVAKGKDGNQHSYSVKNVVVEIAATAIPNNKEMRKAAPGYPLPKDEAKKLDEEIKKEQEEQEKAAEEGVESPEVESMKKRSVAPEEAPTAAAKRGR